MKSYLFLSISILVLGLAACKKECKPSNTICNEKAPTNELCEAFFTRWFFNGKSNSCEQISYSGCTQAGFATKEECEQCKCH